MFNNQKIKTYIFLFLAFCVLSSKSIIIYNEETLVALSFLIFVFFSFHYFGNTAKESLDERASTIRDELQNFLLLKEESLKELLQEHKKISQVKTILSSLGSFTETQLSTLSSSGGNFLNSRFALQLQQKVGTLLRSRSTLQQKLQLLIAKNIQPLLITRMEGGQISGKENLIDPKIMKKSIQFLKKKYI